MSKLSQQNQCLFVLVEGKNSTTTEAPSTTSGPIDYDPQNISYCIRPQWVGDNECDPVCNTPWCNFDDGDCEGKQCRSGQAD